jgi:hypothetical protein
MEDPTLPQVSLSSCLFIVPVLQDIMRNQYELFLNLAAQVATLHEKLEELKEAYLNFRRKYFSDISNPFQEAELRRKKRSFLTRESQLMIIIFADNYFSIQSTGSSSCPFFRCF